MTFVLGLLAVTAVVSSILLMFVILLQEPKGGGLAAALGGSGMDAIGANVGQVNRFTMWVAGIWIGACLLHGVMQRAGTEISGTGTENAAGGEVKKQPGDQPQPADGKQAAPGDEKK